MGSVAQGSVLNVLNACLPQDESILDDKITICHYKANSYLCKQGDADADLTFIIKGELLITQKVVDQEDEDTTTTMFTARAGEVCIGISLVNDLIRAL
jgi:CRP-like cAMP-binding protein